jgi:hypothetical protein
MKTIYGAVTAMMTLACAMSLGAAGGAAERVKTGAWGGTGLLVRVTADGATIEADCANGSIATPLMLDADGAFSVEGTWIPEARGPSRDEAPARQRSRYAGRVDGKTMTLEISVGDDRVGPFTLTHGSEGRLRKCR